MGVITKERALDEATKFGLDLVEVSPNAEPPVCKIMDFGRFKYEQQKKQQEARKKQSSFQIKEIKVRPKTGDHDLNTKIGHIKRFIQSKDKVKVSVMFRGREITLTHQGKEMLERIADATEEVAVVEQMPKLEGRNMFMLLAPK
ncbi:Translation initiation factor 3 [Candidatus Magnetomorum sp. HK-1]|nr:Translation initiation factor 3 [Candidatus Magnetomorum sp. HK-1]